MSEDLKSICIIKGKEPFWKDVKKFLSGTNAEFFSLESAEDLTALKGLTPTLLIMNTDSYFALPPAAASCMKLVIEGKKVSPAYLRPRSGRKTIMIDWPQEEKVFLELTSRMLTIPPRRFFRAMIRILPKSDTIAYVGESEDFSLTGLGFRTDHALNEGEEVKISVALPNKHQPAHLEAEVVRRHSCLDDQSTLYGARYVNLATDTRTALTHFIQSI